MTGYKAWLHEKVRLAQDRFRQRNGWTPAWPNTPRLYPKREDRPVPEELRPFNRVEIVERHLRWAEQDLACVTRWLGEAGVGYALAVDNVEHFLNLRTAANTHYAKALKLQYRL